MTSNGFGSTLNLRDELIADRSIRMLRPDRERLDGKVKQGRARKGSATSAKLSDGLAKRLRTKAPRSLNLRGASLAQDFDRRQRAVVKIHYFNHAGGGGAALKAHGAYIARDAASAEDVERTLSPGDGTEEARAHADTLERQGKSSFYDAGGDGIDGGARLEDWAKSDLRHFRLIISAEEGGQLRDLSSYTREVMARAGVALGTNLSWVAVNHHDTDNPHSHVVVRGRRENGQDLVMPKDFIKHGLRNIARDVATEWLGRRTREDERLALDRETRRHAPTRLDSMIEAKADQDGRLRTSTLSAPNGDAHLTQAMKSRVFELERMGLAQEQGRGKFQLAPDWREKLQAMELHANIRRRVVLDRVQQQITKQQARTHRLIKGLLER